MSFTILQLNYHYVVSLSDSTMNNITKVENEDI